MKTPSGLVLLTSCIFAIAPGIAFGRQRSGNATSAHGASVSARSSISSHESRTASVNQNSSESGKHSSVVVVSGKAERKAGRGNDRWEPENGSSSTQSVNDRWLNNETGEAGRPKLVTIGFPESGIKNSAISAAQDSPAVGERSDAPEEQVQRGARPAAPVTRPAPAPAPRTAPPQVPANHPMGSPVARSTIRIPALQIQPRRPLWFLAPPNQSQVFRRRFFGGFGFFGFGLPFSFAFGPDCNPFWAEPFAFGCYNMGYFTGYGGYGFAPEEQVNLIEPSQEQEPQENIFVPPQDQSSPEEIQAEKILFVLYMKNGALYALTNYWIEGGKLHYLTSYGGENTIDMSDIDLQKTVDVNAKRGVNFTLKPRSDQGQTNEPQQ